MPCQATLHRQPVVRRRHEGARYIYIQYILRTYCTIPYIYSVHNNACWWSVVWSQKGRSDGSTVVFRAESLVWADICMYCIYAMYPMNAMYAMYVHILICHTAIIQSLRKEAVGRILRKVSHSKPSQGKVRYSMYSVSQGCVALRRGPFFLLYVTLHSVLQGQRTVG